MTDPFATAQVNQPAAGTVDPFTSASDSADPFATSSDYRADFTPSPTLESLQGRLVVMIPRNLDPAAKDPNNPGQTREQYTVDLYVLDGGRFSYFYTQKGNPEATDPADRQDQVKEWVVENVTPDQPFSVTSYWVPQGGVIGKLKKAHRDGRPYLGVPSMIPTKADRDRGLTAAAVRQAVEAWVARNRQGARPRYTWTLEDPTPAQRQAAVAWWGKARTEIAPITPSQG
jgi:hypothetical protein